MNDFDILELYHAGTDKIETPKISFSRPDLDFGLGFYLTDIYEQAKTWAKKRAKKRNQVPRINKYHLLRKELLEDKSYNVLNFPSYNDEWLDFIVENRLGNEKWKGYDLIEGGLADDRVVDTVDLYFSDFIDRKEAIRRLKYLKPNNQICILNQEMLDKYLKFRDCEELDLND